jgi:hypothetical protein
MPSSERGNPGVISFMFEFSSFRLICSESELALAESAWMSRSGSKSARWAAASLSPDQWWARAARHSIILKITSSPSTSPSHGDVLDFAGGKKTALFWESISTLQAKRVDRPQMLWLQFRTFLLFGLQFTVLYGTAPSANIYSL